MYFTYQFQQLWNVYNLTKSVFVDENLEELNPHLDQSEGLQEQEEKMEVSGHQKSTEQGEQKTDFSQDVHHYLGKMDQCPAAIEDPGEEEDRMIMYQTDDATTVENSTESGEFLQVRTAVERSSGDDLMEHSELSDQLDEVVEGQMDHVPLTEVPLGQSGVEMEMKDSNAKDGHMDLDIYSECTQSSSGLPASFSTVTFVSKPDEIFTQSGGGEDKTDGVTDPNSGEDCKNKAQTIVHVEVNNDNLQQNEIIVACDLSEIVSDSKPSDLCVPLPSPEPDLEQKPLPADLPIKLEETKMENVEEALPMYPDSSVVKHEKPLFDPQRTDDLVTKGEQIDYPLREEELECKPEDLSLHIKSENLDSKAEVLQFASFSDGSEVKSEAKPVALCFTAYPRGPKFKNEAKPEGFINTAFHDSIKSDTKPEGLEFAAYPDSSEVKPEAKSGPLDFSTPTGIKTELKQELLEADSTVLTPKLEQTDGLVDSSESLVEKGQVKEESPVTSGTGVF